MNVIITIERRSIKEIKTYLLNYNISDTQRFIILNIFQSYLNSIIKNDSIESISPDKKITIENSVRVFINEYKNKIDEIFGGNQIHNVLISYILKNKEDDIVFESKDEEDLYNEIIRNTLMVEVYCLTKMDYNTFCSILHAIANKLGFSTYINKKYKEKIEDSNKGIAFTKLRSAIKNVENNE